MSNSRKYFKEFINNCASFFVGQSLSGFEAQKDSPVLSKFDPAKDENAFATTVIIPTVLLTHDTHASQFLPRYPEKAHAFFYAGSALLAIKPFSMEIMFPVSVPE
jgi:hypothetical protein